MVNTIRAHLSEFGIVVAKGIHHVDRLLAATTELPAAARPAVDLLADQLRDTQEKIDELTDRIEAAQRTDPLARRLATIPGFGAISASAIAATTPEVDTFRSARDYAAWLGLTPQPHSSGGKERLGRISKAGNRYLRRLLYLGAMARISARRCRPAGRRLALAHAGEKAGESRRGRARQPDGAGRLGAYPDRRELPGQPGMTGHAGRLRPAPRR